MCVRGCSARPHGRRSECACPSLPPPLPRLWVPRVARRRVAKGHGHSTQLEPNYPGRATYGEVEERRGLWSTVAHEVAFQDSTENLFKESVVVVVSSSCSMSVSQSRRARTVEPSTGHGGRRRAQKICIDVARWGRDPRNSANAWGRSPLTLDRSWCVTVGLQLLS